MPLLDWNTIPIVAQQIDPIDLHPTSLGSGERGTA